MIVLKLFGASEANWSWDLSPWALALGPCSLHLWIYRTRKILLRWDPAPGMNRKRSSPAGSMQVRSPSKASSDGAVLVPFNPTFWSQNSVAHALSPSTRATRKSRDGEGIWQAGTMQQRSNCLKMLWVADSCWRQRSSIHVSFSILHGSLSAQGCSGTKSKSW